MKGCGFLLGVAALLAIIQLWERCGWKTVGLKSISFTDFLAVLAISFLDLRMRALAFHLALPWGSAPSGHSAGDSGNRVTAVALLNVPWATLVGFVASDALFEELGSRAYIIERFFALTGNMWMAAAISWAVSILAHAYAWGARGALARAPELFLLVILYVWRRNLLASIAAHMLLDLGVLIFRLPPTLAIWILYLGGFTRRYP